MLDLKHSDPQIFKTIEDESKRQIETINLIASENYVSKAILEAQGSPLTNKYAEGYPSKRYYGGCHNMDDIEQLAIYRAKELFGAEHVNVQPHSGASANLAVYFAALEPGDTVLGMALEHGGHLTHGFKANFSGKYYNAVNYHLNPNSERIDYEEVEQLAMTHKPKLIIVGASAYSRSIDIQRFRQIADKNGALLMCDIAHIAGLIAAGVIPNPTPLCDFVTSTTHKTLRGPRGGFIMCKEEWAKKIDAAVFPRLQGGPLMHVIAAKAVIFKEAQSPEFKEYGRQVAKNAAMMAKVLSEKGMRIISGGTDNHLFLVDLCPIGITGQQAEDALGRCGIVVNKNTIPFAEGQKANIAFGMRIGAAAITSRGFKEDDAKKVAEWIFEVCNNYGNEDIEKKVAKEVYNFVYRFPVPGINA